MAIKGDSAFPKAPVSLELHHQIVSCHLKDTCWWGSYPSAEVQSVYSTAPADWPIDERNAIENCGKMILITELSAPF